MPALAITAAMFHLFTHAFFKALLFLSAGSVMHAMGDVIDMRRVRRPAEGAADHPLDLPVRGPGPGRDAGLLRLLEQGHGPRGALAAGHADRFGWVYTILFGVALATALLTAFYTFRAYSGRSRASCGCRTGPTRTSRRVMTVPLIVLAVGAVAVGIVAEPFTHWFSGFLTKSPDLAGPTAGRRLDEHLNWRMMLGSTAVALGGRRAGVLRLPRPPGGGREGARPRPPALYHLSLNKLYVDEVYNLLFVQPLNLLAGSAGCSRRWCTTWCG